MLSHFLQWSAGWVRIQVRGASVERFLNVCMRGGVSLWRVERPAPDALTAVLSVADFRRLRTLMGRTGCRVHLIGRSGAPFWMQRARRRWALTGGLCLLAVLLFVLSSFVWVLELEAAPGVPVGKLRQILRENGIYEGAPLCRLDTGIARAALQTELPEAGVITFTKIGNAIRVVADRATNPPAMEDEYAQTGLAATRSGVVTAVEVTGGQALVKVGDAVTQGQMLASSIVPPTREEGLYHIDPGKGRVMARTEHGETVLCPTERTKKQYNGKTRTQYALVLGTRRINLYFGSGITAGTCDKIIEKTRLSIGPRLMLPVSVVRQTYRFYESVPLTDPEETAAEAVAARWFDRLAETIDGEILSRTWDTEVVPGAVRVTLHAVCEEQIACQMIDESPLPEKTEPPAEETP